MAENMPDYPAMLADMKGKKVILEHAITSLEAAITAGALGVTAGEALTLQSSAVVSLVPSGIGSDIPKGAFFGKTIAEAILAYLQAVRKKCTTIEIAQGLKKGGIESTSKTFNVVVRNTLHQLKGKGKLLLFDDGWGLPEWVPEGLRSRIEQKNKTQGKKRGPKKKAKTENLVKSDEGSEKFKPKALVENYFSTHQGGEFSAKELAEHLGLSARGIVLILSQLHRKGWLQKGSSNGRFVRTSKITPISKAAG